MAVEATGFDYSESRALLISVSEYDDPGYPLLPAAANSMRAMKEMLTDPALCGWPAERITEFPNPQNAGRFAQQLRRIAERTQGVLLLYFVGHGTITRRGEVCLVLTDSEADGAEFTGLEYSRIRDILIDSPARTKVVVLDCCYAGRAIEALGDTGDAQVADSTDIRGVYTLTASDDTAHVVPFEQQTDVCTSFTAELTDLVQTGIQDGPPVLSLNLLYSHLVRRLVAENLPRPNQRNTDTADTYPFTRNAAAGPAPAAPRERRQRPARPAPPPSARPVAQDGSLRPEYARSSAADVWPDPSHAHSLDELALVLQRTWIRAGSPSAAEISRRSGGHLSERTAAQFAAGEMSFDDIVARVPLFLEACGVSERLIREWGAAGRLVREQEDRHTKQAEASERRNRRWRIHHYDPFQPLLFFVLCGAIPFLLGTAWAREPIRPQLAMVNWVIIGIELTIVAASMVFWGGDEVLLGYGSAATKAASWFMFCYGAATGAAGWYLVAHGQQTWAAHLGLDVRNWLGWQGLSHHI